MEIYWILVGGFGLIIAVGYLLKMMKNALTRIERLEWKVQALERGEA